MKNLPAALTAHLQQDMTTLATCWKLTRRDSAVLGFCDHNSSLEIEGVSYLASSGFTPTSLDSRVGLAVDNLDVEGMLEAAVITESDVLAGMYDFAEVLIFQVNYQDVAAGKHILRRGWLGEVRLQGGSFVAEIRGLTQKLSQKLGHSYSPGCRARLGDAQCTVNLVGFTVSGTVDSVESTLVLKDAARTESAGYFSGGVITFTSGANTGLSMEVKRYIQGEMTLVLPLPFDILANDGYTLIAGCDKTFATCKKKFSNTVNFRGEPHVPGTDRMLETAGTRNK